MCQFSCKTRMASLLLPQSRCGLTCWLPVLPAACQQLPGAQSWEGLLLVWIRLTCLEQQVDCGLLLTRRPDRIHQCVPGCSDRSTQKRAQSDYNNTRICVPWLPAPKTTYASSMYVAPNKSSYTLSLTCSDSHCTVTTLKRFLMSKTLFDELRP